MKKLVYILLSIVLAGVVILELTGNHHLFFALRHTYLKGRNGPSIDEFRIYHNRTIANGAVQSWPEIETDVGFTQEELDYHKTLETASFLVVHQDSILFEYYDEEHDTKSYTNSWSMSKSIIAILLGMAIEDGLIGGVDDLLAEYLPAYQGSGITLEHLLTMSSGIAFDESYSDPFGFAAKSLYGNDLEALVSHYPPQDPPGVVMDYQSGNTILLGLVLQKQLGSTISDYVSEKLWKPLGAEYPAYWSLDHEGGVERVFCCFNSVIRDFARIGRLMEHQGIWNGDTLIEPEYFERMMRPADIRLSDGGENQRYGYQWWLLRMEEYRGYYARGIQGQYLIILPAEELIIVRFGDQRVSTRTQGHVDDALMYIDMARRMVRARS